MDTIDSTQYQYDNNGKMRPKLLVLSTLMVLLVLSGCALSEGGRYRKFTLEEGFVHFSFEYPASYQEEPKMRIGRGGHDNTVVYIIGPAKTGEEAYKGSIVFMITAIGPESVESGYNAEYWYEYDLEQYSSNDSSRHIIEQSIVEEGIVSGKALTYYRIDYTERIIPAIIISREIYYDENGFTFIFGSNAEQGESRQAEADLNHLLRTFKILE